jgi:hypothetical protein
MKLFLNLLFKSGESVQERLICAYERGVTGDRISGQTFTPSSTSDKEDEPGLN